MTNEELVTRIKDTMRTLLVEATKAFPDMGEALAEAIANVRCSGVSEGENGKEVEITTYDDFPGIPLLISFPDEARPDGDIEEDIEYVAAHLLFGYAAYIKCFVLTKQS